MANKQDKAKRLADQYPDQPRQSQDQGGKGVDPRAAWLAKLMIDFINAILSLFTGYRLAGGTNYQKPTGRDIASAAIADELRKDAAAQEPQKVLDQPFELRRVARRLSRGEDPVSAKLSENVLGALHLMSKADLKQLVTSPDAHLIEFADATRKMAFEPKEESTNEKAANISAAALDVDPQLAKRLAMRRQVENGEEVDYNAWFADEPAPAAHKV